MAKNNHSLNYYFLNKQMFAAFPSGYRQTVINILVNKNKTEHYDKFLFVQERGGTWGFSRQGVVDQNIEENLFETLIRNLGQELGFKGVNVLDAKPTFIVKSYFFDIQRQIYDPIRSKAEEEKKRPTKGKIYHLAIIEYQGPDELPVEKDSPDRVIRDYRWVTKDQAQDLLMQNNKLSKENNGYSTQSVKFHQRFFGKIMRFYETTSQIRLDDGAQATLL